MKKGGKWLIPRAELDRFLASASTLAAVDADVIDPHPSGDPHEIAWAGQMETSGHWPDLRKAAADLAQQIAAPLPQLLNLSAMDLHNPSLVLPPDLGAPVSIVGETAALVQALREHLPHDPVWSMLDGWKRLTGQIRRQLSGLVQWVNQQPPLINWPRITSGEPLGAQSGITERFAQTLVQDAVEGAYFNRPVTDLDLEKGGSPYDLSPATGNARPGALAWVQGSMSYVIGVDHELSRLEQVKQYHLGLSREIRETSRLKAVVSAIGEGRLLRVSITAALEFTERRARFPGACSLCAR